MFYEVFLGKLILIFTLFGFNYSPICASGNQDARYIDSKLQLFYMN